MADVNFKLSKEDAQRKAEEKKNAVGITFERMTNGILETRVASSVEHIAAFFNSSDEGPNAKNKQDFGWRLTPEDLIELEDLKNDPVVMERIAQVYQIPPEDVAEYNVLKFMASKRFKTVSVDTKSQEKDYESDYDRRVREARNKQSTPVKAEAPKAESKPAETVKPKDEEKVEKSTEKADNSGKAK